jgi:hypothetical protein
MISLVFDGEIIHWRGPSPFHFVPVPEAECGVISDVAAAVSYGWGVIPVQGTIGETTFTTSLLPRNGGYLVPVKDAVRRAEHLSLGDIVTVQLAVSLERI